MEIYLLDTNVLVLYARASKIGQRLEQEFSFSKSLFKPLVCIVTLGEIRAFAKLHNWGAEKLGILDRIIKNTVTVDISSEEVLDAYAELHTYSMSNGWSIGQNDLWIAAVTKITNATLVTTDADFDPLYDSGYILRIYIDQQTGDFHGI